MATAEIQTHHHRTVPNPTGFCAPFTCHPLHHRLCHPCLQVLLLIAWGGHYCRGRSGGWLCSVQGRARAFPARVGKKNRKVAGWLLPVSRTPPHAPLFTTHNFMAGIKASQQCTLCLDAAPDQLRSAEGSIAELRQKARCSPEIGWAIPQLQKVKPQLIL